MRLGAHRVFLWVLASVCRSVSVRDLTAEDSRWWVGLDEDHVLYDHMALVSSHGSVGCYSLAHISRAFGGLCYRERSREQSVSLSLSQRRTSRVYNSGCERRVASGSCMQGVLSFFVCLCCSVVQHNREWWAVRVKSFWEVFVPDEIGPTTTTLTRHLLMSNHA